MVVFASWPLVDLITWIEEVSFTKLAFTALGLRLRTTEITASSSAEPLIKTSTAPTDVKLAAAAAPAPTVKAEKGTNISSSAIWSGMLTVVVEKFVALL